jgi:hypothetical protein
VVVRKVSKLVGRFFLIAYIFRNLQLLLVPDSTVFSSLWRWCFVFVVFWLCCGWVLLRFIFWLVESEPKASC